MKVLFIGGTGIISSACSQLAINCNLDRRLKKFGAAGKMVAKKSYCRVQSANTSASKRGQ